MGTLLLVVVLILTGIGFAIGWFCCSAAASRRSAAAQPAAPADAVSRAYDDGFRAGYSRAAAAARLEERVNNPAVFSPPTAFSPAPAFDPPRQAPAPAAAAPSALVPSSPPPATPALSGPAAPDKAWFAENAGQPAPDLEPAAPAPVQPPSAEELARRAAEEETRKRRRDLRNINITLYAACLLLVAAASLFIGLAISEGARFAGVTLVAGLFYAGGLVVHSRSRRLRPAAVAFTGTGLALIPVVGLALHNLVLRDAPSAWLVTSVVGTAAYAYAAARLDSRVVAYLSITFLLSTALASGAAMRSGIMWYFLFTVLLATAVSLAAMRRPAWLRNIYLDAFIQSHRFLVPATAGVALLTAVELGGWQFSILFLAFSCYYAVVFLQARGKERLFSSYGFRATATVGLTVLAYMMTDDTAAAVLASSVLLLLQAAGLLALRSRYSALGGAPFFVSDYVLVIVLQILAGLAAAQSAAGILPGGSTSQVLFTATAVTVLLTCMAGAWKIDAVPNAAPAGAALLGLLARLNGETGTLWPAVVLGALLTGYYSVGAARSSGRQKEEFLLWVRGTAVVLAPVVSLAVLESAGAGARETWTWALFTAAAAVLLNQLISVYLLTRRGAAGTAGSLRREVPVVAVAAGLAALLTLCLRFSERPEMTVTLWVLFSALSVNVVTSLVLRRVFEERPWLEWVGPAGFAAAAAVGAGLLDVRGYEVLTAAALAYCGLMAVRLARAGRRGRYLLAGQVLLTVLVALAAADLDFAVHEMFVAVALCVAVQQVLRVLLQDRFPEAGMGQLVSAAQWGSTGVLVLLPLAYEVVADRQLPWMQPLLLLMAAGSTLFVQLSVIGRRAAGKPVPSPDGSLAAAAALAAVLTVWLRLAEAPLTTFTLWVLFGALGANVLTTLALRHFSEGSWLQWAAPAGFAAAGVIGAGVLGVRGYEVLVAAALAYCAFMVVRGARAEHRGSHLLAAQVLLTVLAALAAADLDLTIHGTCIAVAVSVAGQQVVRTLLQGLHTGTGLRQLGKTALWGSAGVLTLLPLAYAAAADGDARRYVVVISLSLLLGMSVTVSAADRNAGMLYPAVYALAMLPLVLTHVFGLAASGTLSNGSEVPAPLSLAAAGVLLLVLAAAALAAETRSAIGAAVRNPLLAGGALYCFLAVTLASLDGNGLLTGISVLLPAAGFLAVSFTRRLPWLAAVTVALVPVAAFIIRSWLVSDVLTTTPHDAAARLGSGFAAALLLYAAGYVLSVLPQTADTVLRRSILSAGAAVIAAGAGISAMPYDHISAVYGSVVLVAALAAAVREFPRAWRESAGEAAALVAALSVQRIIWYAVDSDGWFWSLQYWVVVLAALAAYEYRRGRAQRGTAVLAASAGLLSCTGVSSIFSADSTEQVWALVAHAGLLGFGVLTNRRLFTVWGAAGVALAVLWYLRGYTFLLLALLAAALIALAVWRLTRVRAEAADQTGS